VKLDELPAGAYILQLSNNQNFDKNNLGFKEDISFFVNDWIIIDLGKYAYQLLNRKTGKPIANKQLQLWNENAKKKFNASTDTTGIFAFPNKDEDYMHLYHSE
jgi:hypothetical protein